MKKSKKLLVFILLLCLSFTIVACKNKDEINNDSSQKENNQMLYKAGKYNGLATGHNGTLEVEVEVSDNDIISIDIIRSDETEHLSKSVFETIPNSIIENQSLNVDTISGATVTSNALKLAITDALKKADADINLLKNKEIQASSVEEINLQADVIIVGGGGAGLVAALSAEEQGLDVILIEKNAMLGGHTALSGGYTTIAGSKLQKSLGVDDDSPEIAYKDIMLNGGNKSVPELLTLYTENMGRATDWTIEYANAKPQDKVLSYSENTKDRVLIYEGHGEGFINALTNKLNETSVDVYLNTKATNLITESNDVIGVEAEDNIGNKYIIKAKSTVLATGGYGARKDLLPERFDNFLYYGAALSSGDALTMGENVDADTVNMGYCEIYQDGVEWQPGIAKSTVYGTMAAWYESGIFVDRNGKRVVNELGTGASIVEQQEAQDDGRLFLFMDQKTFDSFCSNIGGTGISEELLEEWINNNGSKSPIFASGKTIEEVCDTVGVDSIALKDTIERYNGFVENKKDEDFDRPSKALINKIGEGPYYLVEQKPRYATTLGGLLINDNLQVINKSGQIINGLYAAGDAAGGVRGDTSIPGADLGWAVTSGYLIGEILAK